MSVGELVGLVFAGYPWVQRVWWRPISGGGIDVRLTRPDGDGWQMVAREAGR